MGRGFCQRQVNGGSTVRLRLTGIKFVEIKKHYTTETIEVESRKMRNHDHSRNSAGEAGVGKQNQNLRPDAQIDVFSHQTPSEVPLLRVKDLCRSETNETKTCDSYRSTCLLGMARLETLVLGVIFDLGTITQSTRERGKRFQLESADWLHELPSSAELVKE